MSKKLVEVARSFSMKKNLGNYESVDFFASQKAEVSEDKAEETSEKLYQFCKAECVKSYNDYLKEHEPKETVTNNVIAGVDFSKPLEDFHAMVKSLNPTKKQFEKPWEKQIRKATEEAHAEFGETSKKAYKTYAPIHQAADKEGGKKLINREENTTEPK